MQVEDVGGHQGTGSHAVCSHAGGDISSKNLWLAESVLDILLEQKYVSHHEHVVPTGGLTLTNTFKVFS